MRLVWALLALLAVGSAQAFQTINAIKANGRLTIGVHAADDSYADRLRARQFAAFLGVDPQLEPYTDYEALLSALTAGEVDLVATLMDRERPIADELTFSPPIEFRDMGILGQNGPVAIVYQSDAWYRAISVRARGDNLALKVVPANTSSTDLRQAFAGHAIAGYEQAGDAFSRLLGVNIPRSWVLRSGDRVLRSKVEQFLHREALVSDAKAIGAHLPTRLVRAMLNDGQLTPYDDVAKEYGRIFGFDWRLVLAIMHTESRFDPEARSSRGAEGLMQVTPVATAQIGLHSIETEADNILAGVRYLEWVRNRFEDDIDIRERIWFSLAAYNAGLTHVRRARKRAAETGLDRTRWFDHVERAYRDYARGHNISPAKVRETLGYVSLVRRQFAIYVRLTDGPEGFERISVPTGAVAP